MVCLYFENLSLPVYRLEGDEAWANLGLRMHDGVKYVRMSAASQCPALSCYEGIGRDAKERFCILARIVVAAANAFSWRLKP